MNRNRRRWLAAGLAGIAGFGAWRLRSFWPQDGFTNPCLGPLPPDLASHPLVTAGLGRTRSAARLGWPRALLHQRRRRPCRRRTLAALGFRRSSHRSSPTPPAPIRPRRTSSAPTSAGCWHCSPTCRPATRRCCWRSTSIATTAAKPCHELTHFSVGNDVCAAAVTARARALRMDRLDPSVSRRRASTNSSASRRSARAPSSGFPRPRASTRPANAATPSTPRSPQARLPLLTHAGAERATPGDDELDNPLRLRRALDHGVRVIAAHCATMGKSRDLDRGPDGPMVDSFTLFERLMDEPRYEKLLVGDLSAIPQLGRTGAPLRRIIERGAPGGDWSRAPAARQRLSAARPAAALLAARRSSTRACSIRPPSNRCSPSAATTRCCSTSSSSAACASTASGWPTTSSTAATSSRRRRSAQPVESPA